MPILKDEKRLASLPLQDELFSLHKGSANGTFYFPLTIRKSNRLGDYYFALPTPMTDTRTCCFLVFST